jgi:flagellar biosynthesis protein FlhF
MVAAVRALIRSGLSVDLARRFARAAARSADGVGRDTTRLASAAEDAFGELLRFASTPLASRVLFVAGPPGAGKTTTVAKLAARAGLTDRGPVVFAAADTERVGALEQAQVFSRHLGLCLARVASRRDLARAVDRAGRRGTVLVDTAGIGTADADRLSALADLREACPDASLALLVPAGLHRDEARQVIERFAPLRPSCVGFSRVDDGGRLGELVTAVAPTGWPVAFFTTGHRVPQDLENASPRGLAARLLRAGCESADRPEARP